MASAILLAKPGARECEICSENVKSVKILPCKHCMCARCLEKLTDSVGAAKLSCPTCRKAVFAENTEPIRTKYFGKLSCDYCSELKDTADFWWCTDCKVLFCSRCTLKNHKFPGHKLAEWDSFGPIDACQEFFEKAASEDKKNEDKNLKILRQMFEPIFQQVSKQLSEKHLEDKRQLTDLFGPRSEGGASGGSLGGSIMTFEDASKILKRLCQLVGSDSMKLMTEKLSGTVIVPGGSIEDPAHFVSAILANLSLGSEQAGSPKLPQEASSKSSSVTQIKPAFQFTPAMEENAPSPYQMKLISPDLILVWSDVDAHCYRIGEEKFLCNIHVLPAYRNSRNWLLYTDVTYCSGYLYLLQRCRNLNEIYRYNKLSGKQGTVGITGFRPTADGCISCTSTGVVYFVLNFDQDGAAPKAYILKLNNAPDSNFESSVQKQLYSESNSRFKHLHARYDCTHTHAILAYDDIQKSVRVFRFKNPGSSFTQIMQISVPDSVDRLFYSLDGLVLIKISKKRELWKTVATTAAGQGRFRNMEKFRVPPELADYEFMRKDGAMKAVSFDCQSGKIIVYNVKVNNVTLGIEMI